jgi:glycosyltransferase involved in cell wall biosynthesis
MSKFIGIKNNNIVVISDNSFVCEGMNIMEIPKELENISDIDLISNYKLKNDKLINKNAKKSIKELKIALVSNWKIRCGIATYAEYLWGEIIKNLSDFKLFIEQNDNYVDDIYKIGNEKISKEQLSICWKRGESLQNLISEIKRYDPDIVWIQHEFGLWPNARYWLSLMNQLSDYRVIVTMHSVFHHKDKIVCEAAIPEIITHLPGGFSVLKEEKQIPGVVHVVPHGCFPCLNKEKLWNFYKSEHTFMQFGFGFRYKGWENSIKAVSILKNKYNDVFFTGLFSESTYSKIEHNLYYNKLMSLVEELNIQDNVALIKGFQSDVTLDSYLKTNRVAIFPYVSNPEHEVFGASGAARIAMSKAIPVITSSVNHFSDLPTIKADTPEEIAVELEKLFNSSKAKEEQIDKQIKYLEENSWENIAKKHIEIFEN